MEHLRTAEYYLSVGGVSFNYLGILICLLAAFCLWASVKDKEWYWAMTNGYGYVLEKIIGKTGFRYFCILMNAGLFVAGGLLTLSSMVA